jgi:hypothetical protein
VCATAIRRAHAQNRFVRAQQQFFNLDHAERPALNACRRDDLVHVAWHAKSRRAARAHLIGVIRSDIGEKGVCVRLVNRRQYRATNSTTPGKVARAQ